MTFCFQLPENPCIVFGHHPREHITKNDITYFTIGLGVSVQSWKFVIGAVEIRFRNVRRRRENSIPAVIGPEGFTSSSTRRFGSCKKSN